jgi:molecular chaperone IbpA
MTFNSADLATLIERSRKLHVGMEDQFDRMWRVHNAAQGTLSTNYPPYNILKDGDYYTVEIAVAGFREEDIIIEVKDNQLIVQGKISNQPSEDGPQFVHRGIAAREFERAFVLSDDVFVNGANLEHGMLSIHLEHIIPEAKKPRKIEINSSSDDSKKLKKTSKKVEFLSE